MSPREESWMPRAYPPEFRRRAGFALEGEAALAAG